MAKLTQPNRGLALCLGLAICTYQCFYFLLRPQGASTMCYFLPEFSRRSWGLSVGKGGHESMEIIFSLIVI